MMASQIARWSNRWHTALPVLEGTQVKGVCTPWTGCARKPGCSGSLPEVFEKLSASADARTNRKLLQPPQSMKRPLPFHSYAVGRPWDG